MDFENISPYAVLLYFTAVIFFGMTFMHPLFVAVNVTFSVIACLCICRNEYIKSVKYTTFFACLIIFLNPVFNSRGKTVLFRYFNRVYSFEALVYGFVLAGIFISSVNWFSCLGKLIQTDKFMYIFGGRFPALCSLLSMVLGLIPFFQTKLVEISQTQKLIIHNNDNKYKHYFQTFNTAVSYSFEHAIMMSFAMKNRGFGSAKSTHYKQYPLSIYDKAIIIVTALLFIGVTNLVRDYAVNVSIYPRIKIADFNGVYIIGFILYTVLLALPLINYSVREIRWKHLISKI